MNSHFFGHNEACTPVHNAHHALRGSVFSRRTALIPDPLVGLKGVEPLLSMLSSLFLCLWNTDPFRWCPVQESNLATKFRRLWFAIQRTRQMVGPVGVEPTILSALLSKSSMYPVPPRTRGADKQNRTADASIPTKRVPTSTISARFKGDSLCRVRWHGSPY